MTLSACRHSGCDVEMHRRHDAEDGCFNRTFDGCTADGRTGMRHGFVARSEVCWVMLVVLVGHCGCTTNDRVPPAQSTTSAHVHHKDNFAQDTWTMTLLTVDEATALVCAVAHSREDEVLNLNGLKSIEPEVAHELAKFEGAYLTLDGLTSIDKAVAQELVRFRGGWLGLDGLTSIEEETLECLKSNPSIRLPETYQDEKKAD